MISSFLSQTNSHCNYFEWVDDEESNFQGKETESEASGGKRVDGGKKRGKRWSFFEKGKNYTGFDEEKWEVEDEIVTREKNWDIKYKLKRG